MAEIPGLTFNIQKCWDAARRVWQVTLCHESGKRICTVEASEHGVIVVNSATSFTPIGQFPAEADRATVGSRSDCPHCGNAEGNVGRLRCFICNREM